MDFNGTFDGNGHTISGLKLDSDTGAFFDNVADGSVIKNVDFEDVDVTGKHVSVVAYVANAATIENVNVLSGSLTATGYAASIVNEGYGTTIKDCINYADIDAGYSASGIGGWIVSDSTVDGCENYGNITGGNRAGGICGNFAGTMTNCTNKGDVVSTGSGAAGGMIGIASEATTIENCTNNGDVTTTADNANASAAGILGQAPSSKGYTIKSCVNTGAITAEQSHAAGIAVSLYGKVTADGCTNTGTIDGADGEAEIVAPKGIFSGTNTVK